MDEPPAPPADAAPPFGSAAKKNENYEPTISRGPWSRSPSRLFAAIRGYSRLFAPIRGSKKTATTTRAMLVVLFPFWYRRSLAIHQALRMLCKSFESGRTRNMLDKIKKKSRAVLKAVAEGRSCGQILAADPTLNSHDIFHALS